jgi:hypothetical protein
MANDQGPGCSVVSLLLPFTTSDGVKHERIVFHPVAFKTTLQWEEGAIAGIIALMALVSKETIETIENLLHPDADRVSEAFMVHVPRSIRDSIAEGRVPMRFTDQPRSDDEPAPAVVDTPEHGQVAADTAALMAETQSGYGGFPVVEGAFQPPAANAGIDLELSEDGHS